jgi:hypothetical protein
MRTPMPTMMRMMAKSRFMRPPLDAGVGVCAGAVVVVVVVVVVSVFADFDIVSVGSAGATDSVVAVGA